MSEVLDHLMGDLRRLTACRTKCPECGHVGMASWTREEDVCRCRSCGARFRFRANTYRPLTEGMGDEERRRFYRRNRRRIAELPPEERERQRELSRIRNRRYRERRKATAMTADEARERVGEIRDGLRRAMRSLSVPGPDLGGAADALLRASADASDLALTCLDEKVRRSGHGDR